MYTKIEVSKIILKINNKELALTFEEAKELSKTLKDLFSTDEEKYIYIPDIKPYTPPSYPYPYPVWYTTYNNETNSTVTISNSI